MTFYFMCLHIIFSSVPVAKWPPFCILTICNIIFRFGFEDWICILIDSVPDLCILFTSRGFLNKMTGNLTEERLFVHVYT